MLNKATLIGNLGNDPEIRYMQDGTAVANLSVATSEAWKDKGTGERKEKTEWHRVSFFGRMAEVAEKYLHKGSKVYIEGSIHTRKWQDQEGNDRYSTEIKGREMKMLDPKQANSGSDQSQAPQQEQAPLEDDSEIPF